MGLAKQAALSDMGLSEFVQEIIDSGELDDDKTALGVALLAADKGIDVFSDKQRYVFDTYVVRVSQVCKNCGDAIPWFAMSAARCFEDGFCGDCRNQYYKTMAE